MPGFIFTQLVSDYNPLNVGNFWVQQNDTSFGLYQPMVSRTDIEAIDMKGNDEYYRLRQEITYEDSSGQQNSHWYMWARFDSTGFVMVAFGDTSIIDSANFFDIPLPFFPNEAINVGYSWEFDFPGTGIGDQHWNCIVESISETVEVPAGIFNNCIKLNIIITDTLGATIQTNDYYFAEGVGQVLNEGWSSWVDNMKLELVDYYVLPTVDVNKSPIVPIFFDLKQNFPNPFNPVTHISYSVPESGYINLSVYNLLGKKVANLIDGFHKKGVHNILFNARNMASGIYIYQLVSNNQKITKKMLLLR